MGWDGAAALSLPRLDSIEKKKTKNEQNNTYFWPAESKNNSLQDLQHLLFIFSSFLLHCRWCTFDPPALLLAIQPTTCFVISWEKEHTSQSVKQRAEDGR